MLDDLFDLPIRPNFLRGHHHVVFVVIKLVVMLVLLVLLLVRCSVELRLVRFVICRRLLPELIGLLWRVLCRVQLGTVHVHGRILLRIKL